MKEFAEPNQSFPFNDQRYSIAVYLFLIWLAAAALSCSPARKEANSALAGAQENNFKGYRVFGYGNCAGRIPDAMMLAKLDEQALATDPTWIDVKDKGDGNSAEIFSFTQFPVLPYPQERTAAIALPVSYTHESSCQMQVFVPSLQRYEYCLRHREAPQCAPNLVFEINTASDTNFRGETNHRFLRLRKAQDAGSGCAFSAEVHESGAPYWQGEANKTKTVPSFDVVFKGASQQVESMQLSDITVEPNAEGIFSWEGDQNTQAHGNIRSGSDGSITLEGMGSFPEANGTLSIKLPNSYKTFFVENGQVKWALSSTHQDGAPELHELDSGQSSQTAAQVNLSGC